MTDSVLSMTAFAEKARAAAAEGCVLLRNEAQALPIEKGCRAAVFGRAQMNYFKSGLGSGGLVNARYVKGIWEALSDEAELTVTGVETAGREDTLEVTVHLNWRGENLDVKLDLEE